MRFSAPRGKGPFIVQVRADDELGLVRLEGAATLLRLVFHRSLGEFFFFHAERSDRRDRRARVFFSKTQNVVFPTHFFLFQNTPTSPQSRARAHRDLSKVVEKSERIVHARRASSPKLRCALPSSSSYPTEMGSAGAPCKVAHSLHRRRLLHSRMRLARGLSARRQYAHTRTVYASTARTRHAIQIKARTDPIA